jgi:hypothetical protein
MSQVQQIIAVAEGIEYRPLPIIQRAYFMYSGCGHCCSQLLAEQVGNTASATQGMQASWSWLVLRYKAMGLPKFSQSWCIYSLFEFIKELGKENQNQRW